MVKSAYVSYSDMVLNRSLDDFADDLVTEVTDDCDERDDVDEVE